MRYGYSVHCFSLTTKFIRNHRVTVKQLKRFSVEQNATVTVDQETVIAALTGLGDSEGLRAGEFLERLKGTDSLRDMQPDQNESLLANVNKW